VLLLHVVLLGRGQALCLPLACWLVGWLSLCAGHKAPRGSLVRRLP
jgi:hypothetical protein